MTHNSQTFTMPMRLRDQRLRPPLQAHYADSEYRAPSWRAVAFRAGNQNFLIAAATLRGVSAVPSTINTIAGCTSWFSGLVATEYGVMAVTDLAAFLAGDAASPIENGYGQLLLLDTPLANTALRVDQVYGLQRLHARPESAGIADDLAICCSATVIHENTRWPLLNPFKLSASRRFMNIIAD